MRGRRVEKRKLEPDPVYNSRLVHRLVNRVMEEGKKAVAERIVYKALEKIKAADKNPVEVLEAAVKNVGPRLEVHPRRVGGASYQVPTEVKGDRRESLALRWIVSFAKQRSHSEYKTMIDKLAAELLDASSGTGGAIKKRDEAHRMAEANKAFAHFRW
ncbi:MAG: 30S ribosomal protein S7 [Candidatus Woykebacteria bacterium GWB1_45_5]|uniref:Small ribosomal subunit protein uS7 n=2 Tax=Candidatus Woykeibacteriota TaxID=1817899 RepID=A0A1G1W2L8_9BACT|nr:MAG: 30S ribosomal protein S7 [Candidatus Woykebacteria bacterium GWA1_44_8]OGY22590.1 MAG: 30S ribosomal protein S7 [Candidatus Woykebacteria bacterium GWB1_45_5]